MGKFIKVTVIEKSGTCTEHFINTDSIESLKSGNIRLKNNTNLNIKENIDQIEARLLRDEFAMSALNGLLSDRKNVLTSREDFSEASYRIADAMLKERSK